VSLFERFSRTVALISVGVVVTLGVSRLAAQTLVVDASDLHQPTSFDEGWLVEAGDNPAWADPNYDDSHWHRFNAGKDSLHTLFPNKRPDIVWYRLHIEVAHHDVGLGIEEWRLSSALEIYSNGVKILQVGSVSPYSAYDYNAHLLALIPRDQIARENIVIAVRAHISSSEWASPYPGFYYFNLVFGLAGALRQHIWLSVIGTYQLLAIDGLLILGMVVGTVLLYSAQRRPEYLFLTLSYSATLLSMPLTFYGALHAFPAWWHVLDSLSSLFGEYLLARTYLAFIGRPVSWRMNAFLVFVSITFSAMMTLSWMNISTATTEIIGAIPFVALYSVVLPGILISAVRRGNRDASILLVPLLLTSSVYFLRLVLLGLEQIPALRVFAYICSTWLNSTTAGPFTIQPDAVAGILTTFSMALIILLRSNSQSRQQAQLDSELEHARAVQQMILPETVESVPGFRLESVYEPAQQLGGDFFQAIPDGTGGLLVVVGDVAGKGLPAALLVSILVGAIRTVASYTHDPAEVLAQLNERLLGRTCGGFATAIVAQIALNGAIAIANAGHLSPYLDGREVELPGALPLGIDAKTIYATQWLALAPGSRLVFYSDGVVEAQNANRELLGFTRAAELSTRPAAEIAVEAKRFGQSDDITVVTIEREEVMVGAA
jgi:phosphoserine phosphatase RsbU/P